MTIKTTCPHCAQRIEAPSEVVGTVVSCPTCNNDFHVGRRPPVDKEAKVGTYHGTCTNTIGEKPVVSRLTLTVARQEHQTVHGKVTVTGALYVDLEFSATVVGSRMQFVTATPNKKLRIEWSAEIEDDALRGTFSAINTGFWARVFGCKHQQGDWQCRKERMPIIGRLKSFAQGVLGLIVLVAAIGGGIIAFIHSHSTPSYPTVADTAIYASPRQPSYVPQPAPTGFDNFVNEHGTEIEMISRLIKWGIEQKLGGQTDSGKATNPSVRHVPGSDSHRDYYRTTPNNTRSDNFSSDGNVNPYTGQKGYNK